MIETMTEPIVEAPPAPMCPCGKPMGYQEASQSWRCLACNPIPMDAPICATQKCKRPLTKLGPPQNCWRCLVCNPIRKTKPTEIPKKKYIDVTITDKMVREIIKEELTAIKISMPAATVAEEMEEKIREIVVDEMANWHIQKPPVTQDEIIAMTETPVINAKPVKDWTWLQKAKSLGIRTHNEGGGGMRKKVDILADMERLGEPPPSEKELLENIEKFDKAENVLATEAKETEESPKGDVNVRP